MTSVGFSSAAEIADLIYLATQNLGLRKLGIQSRQDDLQSTFGQLDGKAASNEKLVKLAFDEKLVKLAFDTRRIDQETTYVPRRNLQYYHRSAPFVDDETSNKIAYIMKVKTAVDLIKDKYHREPEWGDSYARVLSSAVDRALRTEQKDADFFKAQFNYLDELLYVRYRINHDDLMTMAEKDIERVILSRDENLLHKQIYGMTRPESIVKAEETLAKAQYPMIKAEDPLVERLMGTVKASGDNKSVERTVSITVRDQINDLAKTASK